MGQPICTSQVCFEPSCTTELILLGGALGLIIIEDDEVDMIPAQVMAMEEKHFVIVRLTKGAKGAGGDDIFWQGQSNLMPGSLHSMVFKPVLGISVYHITPGSAGESNSLRLPRHFGGLASLIRRLRPTPPPLAR